MVKHNTYSWKWRVVGVVVLLSLWELNAQFGAYRLFAPSLPRAFFPTVSNIGATTLAAVSCSSYWSAVALTTVRVLLVFVLATALAISVALCASQLPRLGAILYYPFEFFRQLPAVAVIPFAILLFGIHTKMKVAVGVFACFFPVYVATMESLSSVDPLLLQTARCYSWTGRRLMLGVLLPSITPAVIGAMYVALSIALIVTVMGEMLVGSDGLGGRLAELEVAFRLRELYADTLLLGAWGVILNQILRLGTRLVYFWKEEASEI